MTDKTDYNAEVYGAPVNNDGDVKSFRSRDESKHSDEEMAVDPMHAPLKRQLQSRHLQMIAIGGL
jgi:amino acid permease